MIELWVHEEKRRYYKFIVYNDLLGDRVLLRNWGSLDSQSGRQVTQLIENKAHEQHLISNIRKRRKQHCYKLVK